MKKIARGSVTLIVSKRCRALFAVSPEAMNAEKRLRMCFDIATSQLNSGGSGRYANYICRKS
jgi:hypothetical protein